MSNSKSYTIRLTYSLDATGSFKTIILRKGSSTIDSAILTTLNGALRQQLIPVEPITIMPEVNEPVEPKPVEPEVNEPVEPKPVEPEVNESVEPKPVEPEVNESVEPKPVVPEVNESVEPITIVPEVNDPTTIIAQSAANGSQMPVMFVPNQGYIPMQFVPITQPSATIGKSAEERILEYLFDISITNTNFQVEDTSAKKGHGDIAIKYRSKRICVEIKNYKTRLPAKEILKYHKSLGLAEYDAGILIQMGKQGFAASEDIKSPIDLKTENNKPSAYITNCQPEFIYPIVNMLIASLNTSVDQSELQTKHKALINIHDKISKLRKTIDIQKKSISTIEDTINTIIKLSAIA